MDVSIIVPLVESRGRTLDAIASWTRRQTFARDRFEVLVVGNAAEAAFRRRVEELLGPNDRLIESDEGRAPELYNLAAGRARARLLFLTEAHCVGDPRCLEHVVAFVDANGLNGAFCRSHGLPSNRFADMEQRLFEHELALRSAAMSNVISIRGTAIETKTFLEAGGFDARYGHFAELLLGDALEARASRMGFATEAMVFHENVDRAPALIAGLEEYGRDECRFASAARSTARRCRLWEERASFDASLARARLAALARHGARLVARGRVRGFGSAAAPLLLPALGGAQAWYLASRLHLAWLRVSLAANRGRPETCFRLYRRLWDAAIRQGGYALLAEQAPEDAVSQAPYDVAERHDPRLVGFHDVERSEAGPFRWTEPVAAVRVGLPPANYVVTLRLAGPPRDLRDAVGLYFDGHRIDLRRDQSTHDRMVFSLGPDVFRAGQRHDLVLVCPCHPVDRTRDARRLAMPIAAIELAPG